MKDTNKVMKNQMKKINIDGVEDVVMDMEDMMEDCNEISDILGGQIGTEVYDEGELEAELDAMAFDMDEGVSLDGIAGTAPAAAAEEPAFDPMSEFTK